MLDESRFTMWRAIIAMVHADDVVTPHELSFLRDHMRDLQLSESQKEKVTHDLKHPQNVAALFSLIGQQQDRQDFFALARALSWCDGDLDEQEEKIIQSLEQKHMNDETMSLLQNSRNIKEEVDLCENQWRFKSKHGRELFGFLSRKSTSA